MLFTFSVTRHFPGSTGPGSICDFTINVNDLDKDTGWLLKIFRDKNYEIAEQNWSLPRGKITFRKQPNNLKKLSGVYYDQWVIRFSPAETQGKINSFLKALLME